MLSHVPRSKSAGWVSPFAHTTDPDLTPAFLRWPPLHLQVPPHGLPWSIFSNLSPDKADWDEGTYINVPQGLLRWRSSKESACQCRRCEFEPWVGKIPWRRKWQPTPVYSSLWAEEPGRLQSMGLQELDVTEWLKCHHWALQVPPKWIFLLSSFFF